MMPSRPPIASLRSWTLSGPARRFCCSQCLAHRFVAQARLRSRITALRDVRLGRFASTTASLRVTDGTASSTPNITPVIAINKPLDIQPANKELYQALEQLKRDAPNHVGISRLELALRSLEGKNGVTRVAVLSMGGQVSTVKRLVRLLLADPLGKQEKWESELAESDDGGSVLIKHGEGDNIMQPTSSVPTIHVPSRTLQKHNLEILVSSLDLETAPSEFGPASRAHDAILVPGFASPATSTGHYSHIAYPVHQTLLVGSGIQSLISYGKFTSSIENSESFSKMVKLAITTSAQSAIRPPGDVDNDVVLLNVETGEHALNSIRQSISNALTWEHGWFHAGIPPLNEWLLAGSATPENELKPAVKSLIDSILDDTEEAITTSTASAELAALADTVPQLVRQQILAATSSWSERAHEELRTQLDLAFSSKNWSRMKWYKLFWRSDDVTMLLNEIVEQRWLPTAEKGAVYLAGRIEGAGLTLANIDKTTAPQTAAPASPAYPTQITTTRALLTGTTIPSLQTLSQSLVLETGTGISVTTALTAMAYIGFANASLFEAGAVFAFGLVISLKRLQNKWESAREKWQGEIRERGRQALKETEDGIRQIVAEGGRGVVDEVGVEDRRKAMLAVENARAVLEKMN